MKNISDEELYRRVSNYYGDKNPKTTSLKEALEHGGERAKRTGKNWGRTGRTGGQARKQTAKN